MRIDAWATRDDAPAASVWVDGQTSSQDHQEAASERNTVLSNAVILLLVNFQLTIPRMY